MYTQKDAVIHRKGKNIRNVLFLTRHECGSSLKDEMAVWMGAGKEKVNTNYIVQK